MFCMQVGALLLHNDALPVSADALGMHLVWGHDTLCCCHADDDFTPASKTADPNPGVFAPDQASNRQHVARAELQSCTFIENNGRCAAKCVCFVKGAQLAAWVELSVIHVCLLLGAGSTAGAIGVAAGWLIANNTLFKGGSSPSRPVVDPITCWLRMVST